MEFPPANGQPSRSSRSSPTLPNKPLPEDTDDGPSREHKELENGTESGQKEDNVLWVDWEGPDDPLNPKKFDICLIIERRFNLVLVGVTKGNGQRRSLFPLLQS